MLKTEIFVNLFRLNKKIITLKQHYIDAMSEKRTASVVLFSYTKIQNRRRKQMLNLFRKDTLTPQTERIYKVPLCIQDTIPIYRIAENGIFELESPTNKDGGKKKLHQFDRMYLFEDINFSTQDEEEKEETGKRFETLLRSMNVSYKIIVSNHYADNGKLWEEILQKAVSKEQEPLAREYHQMIEERLQEGRQWH